MEAELAVGPGVQWIVTPDQDAGRLGLAVVIADRQRAHRQMRGVDAREEALRVTRLAPVRRAERVGEARYEIAMVTAGAGADRDALGTVFGNNRLQLAGEDVIGLVPGDALPLVLAARADALERIFQSVGMCDDVGAGRAFGAEPALVERRRGIALDLADLPAADVNEDATTAVAAPACALVHAIRYGLHRCSSVLARELARARCLNSE